jgi:anthranilate synthase component 2
MSKVLIIDNYDSFTYNLVQMIGSLLIVANAGEAKMRQSTITVERNDAIEVAKILEQGYTHIVLSPGPGWPVNAGICEEVIRQLAGKIPILGVCLGHQAICEVAGAKITYAKEKLHGKSSLIEVDTNSPLFSVIAREERPRQSIVGLTIPYTGFTTFDPMKVQVARYHSLAADESTFPEELKVIGRADDGEVMAVEYSVAPGQANCFGVQFHPESILTPMGETIIKNFLSV